MKPGIRIIGGLYKGKKLPFPDIEGLRPTPNRIRETLFNWLMQDIRGARCLDAFAGSGALGLEAFSRGASYVTFIEQSPLAYANLSKLICDFHSPHLLLIKADTLHYLQTNPASFDLIFLDPPFSKNLLPECLETIIKHNILVKGGLLYLESPQAFDLDESQWGLLKRKQAGQVVYGLFEKRA
ncbi:MAG: 16S rRNA (guanine(966)-N(2))-methyltransferase RsmD [Legionella sp.]|nr:16S rRNA (guanine(966)-N(2))-methyltransferase RsmD [Legionella sp.]